MNNSPFAADGGPELLYNAAYKLLEFKHRLRKPHDVRKQ